MPKNSIEEDIMEDKIEEFDLAQAEKLLENIRFMADLKKFPVQKPNSTTMDMVPLKDWVKWYAQITEWNGKDGVEGEVFKVIYSIEQDMKIVVERIEEGFRKVLSALDRKQIRIELLRNEVAKYKEQIRLMEEQSKHTAQSQNVEVQKVSSQKNKNIDEDEEIEEDEKIVAQVSPQPSKSKVPVLDLGLAIKKS